MSIVAFFGFMIALTAVALGSYFTFRAIKLI